MYIEVKSNMGYSSWTPFISSIIDVSLYLISVIKYTPPAQKKQYALYKHTS